MNFLDGVAIVKELEQMIRVIVSVFIVDKDSDCSERTREIRVSLKS